MYVNTTPNFNIKNRGPLSTIILQLGINNYSDLISFIKILPYGRIDNPNDLNQLFVSNRGTCSTKHALLKSGSNRTYQLRYKINDRHLSNDV